MIHIEDYSGRLFSQTVHHHYRRSCKSNPTGINESGESTTVEHEDDVATEPSLISVQRSTVNDLPENEPTDDEGEYPIDKSIKRDNNRASCNENVSRRMA